MSSIGYFVSHIKWVMYKVIPNTWNLQRRPGDDWRLIRIFTEGSVKAQCALRNNSH